MFPSEGVNTMRSSVSSPSCAIITEQLNSLAVRVKLILMNVVMTGTLEMVLWRSV